jgi:hypothetical protein
VCLIRADATEWDRITKAWVPAAVLARAVGAVTKLALGAAVFAQHTRTTGVYQLRIRDAQFACLALTTACRRKSAFPDNEHHTLDYPSSNAQWNIQPAVWHREE